MKWAAFIVLVLIVGALGAFAVYTFGWREEERDDRALVEAAARQVVSLNATFSGSENDPWTVEHVTGDLWRLTVNTNGREVCLAVYADDFRPHTRPGKRCSTRSTALPG